MTPAVAIRLARAEDLEPLHGVVQRAYRGDDARGGWTHEADLVTGERIGVIELAAILVTPSERLLVATTFEERVIGCVQITDRGEGTAYLGLLCIDPALQAAGLGRLLLAAAEGEAVAAFAARTMEMTVIDRRAELIAYYTRRGYAPTGETRPFPIPLDPPLTMAVLAKELPA